MQDQELLDRIDGRVRPKLRSLILAVHRSTRTEFGPGTPPPESFAHEVPAPQDDDEEALALIEQAGIWRGPIQTCGIALLREIAAQAGPQDFVGTAEAFAAACSAVDLDGLARNTGLSRDDARYVLGKVAEALGESLAEARDITVAINRHAVRLLAPD